MNESDGAKSTSGKYNPVKTAAQTPETSVARWFFTYPIVETQNSQNITLMVDFENWIVIEKGSYCSAVTSTVAVEVLVSDCNI